MWPSDKRAKLIRMANQIGEAFAASPEGDVATAQHLKKFWAPKLIGELIARADEPQAGLNPTAARAVERLKAQGSN